MSLSLVQAQTWQSLNGPLESDVRDIVIKNDTVYVAAWDAGGIFKKAVGTSQWYYSEIAEGEGPYRSGIAILLTLNVDDDGNYYAGGGGVVNVGNGQAYEHFFKSNDYGNSWKEFINGIESDHTIEEIFITSDQDIFIGCVGGILKFRKDENKFEEVGNTYWAYSFLQKEDTLLAGTIEGIEYSVDNGDTWITAGPDTLRVFSIAYAKEKYFFGTSQGIYMADALDQSWTFMEGLPEISVNTLFAFQDNVIAGTDSGAFLISPEDSEVNPVFPELEGQRINIINGAEETIYVGSETGFHSCNFTQNSCTLDGVPGSRVRDMSFQNKDSIIVSTSSKIQRYFTSSSRWDSLIIPLERARGLVSLTDDSIHAISRSYFLDCSFTFGSCDSTQVDPGSTLFNLTENTAEDLFFLVSESTVYQSQNKGNTWNPIFNFDTSRRNFRSPIFSVSDSLLFIDAAGQGLVKYSLNAGSYSIIGFEETGINSFYLSSDGTIYVSAFFSIHKSTDMGETWTSLLRESDVIGGDILIEVVYDEAAGKLYAIGTEGRVYVSDNEGKNWGVNEEMVPIYLENLAIGHNGSLYIGTRNAGIFKNTKPLNPPITISNEEESNSSVPKSFKIHQNYPNPFNPSTTIPFELNQAAEVSISLFNVFGQKVREYNLGLKSVGTHQHQIELNYQASGVYFLQVKTGEHSQTIKISLIK